MTEEKKIDWKSVMTMQMDQHYVAPFWEDEDARITAYGHWDEEELAIEVQKYDEFCCCEPCALHPASDIKHKWVLPVGEPDTNEEGELRLVDEGTPGAIPVTTIWYVR
jgi:hypothetical protein